MEARPADLSFCEFQLISRHLFSHIYMFPSPLFVFCLSSYSHEAEYFVLSRSWWVLLSPTGPLSCLAPSKNDAGREQSVDKPEGFMYTGVTIGIGDRGAPHRSYRAKLPVDSPRATRLQEALGMPTESSPLETKCVESGSQE